jgi:hypothetical protein
MNHNTKLSIQQEWTTLTAEFTNIDTSLEQYFDAFKGMLVASGWHPMTIDQHIIELANELKEDYNKI